LRPALTLVAIGGSAGLAILLLAGAMKTLVIEQRWAMYSLFIGLTLGGVPLVWRLARPATPGLWASAAASFALMVAMSLDAGGAQADAGGALLLFLAGLAGASAMILPGVSGGYLLLLLGQYEPILGAIDDLKDGLLGRDGNGFDPALVLHAAGVVAPVGVGVALGIVGVSNLLKWLLERFEKPTLGVLLGLLVGAVVGLYPFRAPTPPEAGFVHRGAVLSAEEAARLAPRYWPLARFEPGPGQIAGALALLLAGLGATLAVDRIGSGERGGTR
jgi:putative membrane protein